MLHSRSANEWESWLQRLEPQDIDWDNTQDVMFVSSVLLLLFPKRWITEMESAAGTKKPEANKE